MRDSRALTLRLATRAPSLPAPVDEPELLLTELLLHGEQGTSPSRAVRALGLFSRVPCLGILPPRPPVAHPTARPQQPSLLIPPSLVTPLQAGSPPSSGPRRRRARRARASSERAGQPPAPSHSRESASRCPYSRPIHDPPRTHMPQSPRSWSLGRRSRST